MVIEINNGNPYGLLSEAILEKFENQLGTMLPSDYREFLINYNGGQPKPAYFWVEEGHYGTKVDKFYGLHKGPYWFSIDTYIRNERYGMPEGFLPIAEDGFGNTILMRIKNDNKGSIYFLDHEIHPYHHPNSLEGITWLAPSFKEFISNLFDEEEYERKNNKEA